MREKVLEMLAKNPPSVDLSLFPGLSAAAGFTGGENHGEDVLTHLLLACRFMPQDRPLLRLAGLLHDCGKPACFRDGRFRGHDRKSSEMAGEIMETLGFSGEEIRHVRALIEIHMLHPPKIRPTRLRARLLELEAAGSSWKEFLLLRVADKRANLKRAGERIDMRPFVRACRMALSIPEPSKTGLSVSGCDVMEIRKIPEGPEVGRILKELARLVRDGLPNERDILLEKIRAI